MPKGNIAEQTIDFAQKINADLILIVTTKNITFADYILGASEQQIIANSSRILYAVLIHWHLLQV